jgi:uncharacterized protein YjdB
MNKPFVRVNLASSSENFQPQSLDDGLPLLDKSDHAYRTLVRWFGDVVAAPVIEADDEAAFYVQRQGKYQVDARCTPATEAELKGPLKSQYEQFKQRLQELQPATESERLLHRRLTLPASAPGFYFFRHHAPDGPRLVWCWGYQRKNPEEPATPVICPSCAHLYARRKANDKCPHCQGAPAKTRPRSRGALIAAALAVLLVAAAGAYYGYFWKRGKPVYMTPRDVGAAPVAADNSNAAAEPRLSVEPAEWSGPVGGRIPFRVIRHEGEQTSEVTSHVVAMPLDARIVRVSRSGDQAEILAPGRTVIHFQQGGLRTSATVSAVPPANPEQLTIEPENASLNVGATVPLRLWGSYGDNARVDLTESAQWQAVPDDTVFVYRGLVEGLAPGEATITARYRAAPESPWVEATRKLVVANEKYQSLELTLAEKELPAGESATLDITAVTESGKRLSVSGSSELRLRVTPSAVAHVAEHRLHAVAPGSGTLEAQFRDLSASAEFTVLASEAAPTPTVLPRHLALAVGEILSLPGADSLASIESSQPHVAAVNDERRLVGRTPGEAVLTVRASDARLLQEGAEAPPAEQVEIQVTVAAVAATSLAIEPETITALLDQPVRVRVVAQAAENQQFEIAPEALQWTQLPPASNVRFDPARLELTGLTPSGPEGDLLAVRYENHAASATVHVTAPPRQLELTPASLALPVGQSAPLQVWAASSDGRRVEIPADRVNWQASENPNLTFDQGRVTAVMAGGEPLQVTAEYQGAQSNRVEISAVSAEGLQLEITNDRRMLLPGEALPVQVTAVGPAGRTELPPGSFEAASSNAAALTVDPQTGLLTAVAPGEATLTVSQPAANLQATAVFRVADPARTTLRFEPSRLVLGVDHLAPVQLLLREEGESAAASETRLTDLSPVRLATAQPEAVQIIAPYVIGLAPAEACEITAEFQGLAASGVVEVRESEMPQPIRFNPAEARVPPGGGVTPKLEQLVSGETDLWRDVRPTVITWKPGVELVEVPLYGNAASEVLPPRFLLAASSAGPFRLRAEHQGQEAELTVHQETAAPSPPDAVLEIAREGGLGENLPVGQTQRYQVMIREGESARPAGDVQWPADFENAFVRWQAPALTALRAGHTQELSATVGERRVAFRTTTVPAASSPAERPLASPNEQPVEVRVVAEGSPPLRILQGAVSDAFRVIAAFESGATRDVTGEAVLSVEVLGAAQPAVTVEGQRLRGLEPGEAALRAAFLGVNSEEGLPVQVVSGDEAPPETIQVRPERVTLRLGESVRLSAEAFQGEQSLGDVTDLPTVEWKSRTPERINVAGPDITALAEGVGGVTAQIGAVVSNVAEATVVPADQPIPESLQVEPSFLTLRVGETRRLGEDFFVRRGAADFSTHAVGVVSHPRVASYDPVVGALSGEAPGETAVVFSHGGRQASLAVRVTPSAAPPQRPGGGGPADSGGRMPTLVIEPVDTALPVGATQSLRAILTDAFGRRTEVTGSAAWTSSAPATAELSGSQVRAVQAGESQITAAMPNGPAPATATVRVTEPGYTQLRVEPESLQLAVGERRPLTVQAVDDRGAHRLWPHPELAFSVGENESAIVAVSPEGVVTAQAPGSATVTVRWRGEVSATAAVSVGDEGLSQLRLVPEAAFVATGEEMQFQALARRGAWDIPLFADDGVRLSVEDSAVASSLGGLVIRGEAVGETNVIAQLGAMRAVARLTVRRGTAPPRSQPDSSGPPPEQEDPYAAPSEPTPEPADPAGGAAPQAPPESRLVLSGPTRTTVDARTTYTVLLADRNGATRNVSYSGARLIVAAEQRPLVELAPGSAMTARQAGSVTLQAEYGGLISNPLHVAIAPRASSFARLELDIDRSPLVVGQSRPYRVWGYPGDGQPRQDLTWLIVSAEEGNGAPLVRLRTTAGEDPVLEHQAPAVIGRRPGRAIIAAGFPGGVRTDAIELEVRETPAPYTELAISPARLLVRPGETTPPLAAYARRAGAAGGEIVAASLESLDANVLEPAGGGRFIARAPGVARVRATLGELTATAEVTVAGDPFAVVRASPEAQRAGAGQVVVELQVQGSPGLPPHEYRAVSEHSGEATPWRAAANVDGSPSVRLSSPPLADRPGATYRLMLEARATETAPVQRYPYRFRLEGKVVVVEQ